MCHPVPARVPDGGDRAREFWRRPRLTCSLRFTAVSDRKLPDRALNVEIDPLHSCKQIDIDATNRTAAKSHGGRHEVKGLRQYADVFENERIGDRAIFP